MKRTYGRLVNFDQKHRLYNIRPLLLATGITPSYQPKSVHWGCPIVLNQGQDGSCVGHGWAHTLASYPHPIEGMDHDKAVILYFDGQKNDPWEGGAYPDATPFYEGSTVSGGAKGCMVNGLIGGFCWAFTFEDFLIGLSHFGAATIGINWKVGMEEIDQDGFIHYTGETRGGHCVCIDQLEIEHPDKINFYSDYVGGPNSWGETWGVNGRFKMNLNDLRQALSDNGEACFPLAKRQQPLIRPW